MTTRDTQPKRLPRRRARLIAAAVSAAAVWVPNGSRAQELATGFEIEERPIQKVPTTFKFQSRISQAKMPVGSQTFTTLYVNLVRGNSDVLCSEQLNQVQVRDSVLNIEIGRGFNCPLDDIIATNNDLNFQICIQSKENCLKPIALSSVPYAIKATFSQQAQEAHTADIAAQCHYAHRVTADTGLLSVNSQSQYGYGYYDFATPVAPNALSSLAMPTGVTNASGFLQWTPVNASAQRDLTVCSRTHNGATLAKLDVFNVQASQSYFSNAVYVGTESMRGYLEVDGHAHVIGDVDAENGTMRTDLSVGRDGRVGRDLDVGQDVRVVRDTSVGRDVDVGQDIRVARNAHVTGDMDATNGTLRNDLLVRRDAHVLRNAHVTGDMDATNGTLRNDLTVQRDAHVWRDAHVTGDMDATNGTLRNDLLVRRDAEIRRNAHITGDQDATNGKYRAALSVDGSINITGTAGTGGLTAAGDVQALNGAFTQDVGARHATLRGNVTAEHGVVRGEEIKADSLVSAVTVTATGQVSAGSFTTTGLAQAATMNVTGKVSANSLDATNATVTGRLQAGNGSTTGFEVTASGRVIFYDAPQFPNGVVFPAASHRHAWSELNGVPSGLTALGGLACASGQVAKWGPGGWSCSSDADTTYSAGPGIALNGGQFSLNNTGCTNGQLLKFNSSNNTWSCQSETTYSAGAGLALNGGQISLNNTGCTNGQLLKFNSSNNTWSCQSDIDNGITQANADNRYVSSTAVREYRIGPSEFTGGSGWSYHGSNSISVAPGTAQLWASVDLPRNSVIRGIKCSARTCNALTLAANMSWMPLSGSIGIGSTYTAGVTIPETTITPQSPCGTYDGWTVISVSGSVRDGGSLVFDGTGYALDLTLKATAGTGYFLGCQLTYTSSTL